MIPEPPMELIWALIGALIFTAVIQLAVNSI
jgi:hypothetical protein